MKKIKLTIKSFFLLILCAIAPVAVSAQAVENMYFNVDWQLSTPISNSYADVFSGWGANAEAGYFITSNIAVGGFVSYHSNNKYIGNQTLQLSETSAINSDQQHHIFQLPFGATVKYAFNRGSRIQPYIAAKVGANYSDVSTQMNIFKISEDKWGFYTSPEIGISSYLDPNRQVGIHIAAYYSYASNKTNILNYSIDGMNNIGVRVGVSF